MCEGALGRVRVVGSCEGALGRVRVRGIPVLAVLDAQAVPLWDGGVAAATRPGGQDAVL